MPCCVAYNVCPPRLYIYIQISSCKWDLSMPGTNSCQMLRFEPNATLTENQPQRSLCWHFCLIASPQCSSDWRSLPRILKTHPRHMLEAVDLQPPPCSVATFLLSLALFNAVRTHSYLRRRGLRIVEGGGGGGFTIPQTGFDQYKVVLQQIFVRGYEQ